VIRLRWESGKTGVGFDEALQLSALWYRHRRPQRVSSAFVGREMGYDHARAPKILESRTPSRVCSLAEAAHFVPDRSPGWPVLDQKMLLSLLLSRRHTYLSDRWQLDPLSMSRVWPWAREELWPAPALPHHIPWGREQRRDLDGYGRHARRRGGWWCFLQLRVGDFLR
jgi:hypothetical protein